MPRPACETQASPDQHQVPVRLQEVLIHHQAICVWCLGVHPDVGGVCLRREVGEDQAPALQVDHRSDRSTAEPMDVIPQTAALACYFPVDYSTRQLGSSPPTE